LLASLRREVGFETEILFPGKRLSKEVWRGSVLAPKVYSHDFEEGGSVTGDASRARRAASFAGNSSPDSHLTVIDDHGKLILSLGSSSASSSRVGEVSYCSSIASKLTMFGMKQRL